MIKAAKRAIWPMPNFLVVPFGERFLLEQSGGADRASRQEVSGLGHVQAGRADHQQHGGDGDSEKYTIHASSIQGTVRSLRHHFGGSESSRLTH